MITSPFYLINPIVIENLKLFFKGTIIKINPLNSKIKEIHSLYSLSFILSLKGWNQIELNNGRYNIFVKIVEIKILNHSTLMVS